MEERLRICFVSLKFAPIVGGTEVQAEKQARQLQALGHHVTVVTLRLDRAWKREEMLGGLPILRIGGIYRHGGSLRIGRLGHFPIDSGMLLTLWRMRYSYDVIHVFQLSSLSAVAALIGKLTQKPVIINIQTAGPSKAQRIQLERGAALMTDTLTTTSFPKIDAKDLAIDDITDLPHKALGGDAILNFLRKTNAFYQILSTRGYSYLTSNGFRDDQIVHIPGSVDTDKFRPEPERRPDPTKPERTIICVARLDYAKGVDVLLHAWGRMMHFPPEWRNCLKPTLHLVGDGKLKAQLEHIVTELCIQDSVKFLGLRRDIVDLLQQSWGFVLPSRWEGMPNALLEGMACGLPCIATRVSGSEDIISDGANGLLVEPERPDEMAQALRRVLEDTDLAQRSGKEARATVLRGYQLRSVVEQCVELYRRLLLNSKNIHGERQLQQEMPQHAIAVEALERKRSSE
jgi:glycosyltransferase involved in cell wall biosynthesis